MAGLSPLLPVAGEIWIGIYEGYSDSTGVAEDIRYQSQYLGLVGDGIRLTSYEVTDFH